MKRLYKIILLFVILFLVGVLSFIGYINYSMDKTEKLRSVDNSKAPAFTVTSVNSSL
jgi:hypothetical protein